MVWNGEEMYPLRQWVSANCSETIARRRPEFDDDPHMRKPWTHGLDIPVAAILASDVRREGIWR